MFFVLSPFYDLFCDPPRCLASLYGLALFCGKAEEWCLICGTVLFIRHEA